MGTCIASSSVARDMRGANTLLAGMRGKKCHSRPYLLSLIRIHKEIYTEVEPH